MFATLVAAALLVLCAPAAHGFVFELMPGETKCFTEELGTMHRVQLYYHMAKSHAAFVAVAVTGPSGTAIFQQQHAERTYSHYFHPIEAGEHAVCFSSIEKAHRSATSFKVIMTLLPEYEVEAQKPHDPNDKAMNDHNKALMNQARYIETNIEALKGEYQYHKERETDMRETNEATNSRTIWVTVLTILFVGAVRGLHHITLRRYLKAKKILE